LILKAREGDQSAVEALLQRCLPSLRRWAHGKLPASARGWLDTGDVVQDVTLNVLKKLDSFYPRHVGALQAYLRTSVMNRIRDEIPRSRRWEPAADLDDRAAESPSPLEHAIAAEAYSTYKAALRRLRPRTRELVVTRVEVGWTAAEIADRFGFPSVAAARMAVSRALARLSAEMKASSAGGR
jgi:RNA polymerase sigma factor (sigma-70 family)